VIPSSCAWCWSTCSAMPGSSPAAPSREVLLQVLTHFGGSVLQVAAFFGRHRRQVYRWLDRYQIDAGAIRLGEDDAGLVADADGRAQTDGPDGPDAGGYSLK
jgi:hypothetical protein